MNVPEVSILMSVYNGENFLNESISSILEQTFKNFEFIIIDDGSTDNTFKILEDYAKKDCRIKIVTQKNTGLTKALNVGAGIAKGEYIARQDVDDVSMPDRIEKQLLHLKQNSDVAVLGSRSKPISSKDGFIPDIECSNQEVSICVDISKQNFIPHSSAFFRKSIFEKCGRYNEEFKVSQDFELWNKMARYGKIEILNQVLLKRRVVRDGISRKFLLSQIATAAKIRWQYRKSNIFLTFIMIVWFGFRHIIMSFLGNFLGSKLALKIKN